jgi:hypothetical protein
VKEVISYVLAIAGFGVMMVAFSALMGTRKYLEARTMVIHLLRTQPNRAELVCRGQKGTFGEAIAMSMKTAAMLKSTDLNLIVMATKPGYDAQVPMIHMFWKGVFGKVKTGGGLALAGIVMAIGVSTNPALHIILGIVTIAAGVYILVLRADAERGLIAARLEILPEVERAFAEGRYGYLPAA